MREAAVLVGSSHALSMRSPQQRNGYTGLGISRALGEDALNRVPFAILIGDFRTTAEGHGGGSGAPRARESR